MIISGQPKVLIVDDDADIRAFICRVLRGEFACLEAADGLEGLIVARRHLPDLIIADWMMPKMSGVELCRSLKEGPRTAHIPVVLLTARASNESRTAGLTVGADAYVTKPFHPQDLRLSIVNLIQTQRNLCARIEKASISHVDVSASSIDQRFVAAVHDAIVTNLHDDSYSVERLARDIGVSRVQLYRRLFDLIDTSPAELLMSHRLERASVLLRSKQSSVAEVAFSVGFKNASHFAKRFRKRFGVSPTQMLQSRAMGSDGA